MEIIHANANAPLVWHPNSSSYASYVTKCMRKTITIQTRRYDKMEKIFFEKCLQILEFKWKHHPLSQYLHHHHKNCWKRKISQQINKLCTFIKANLIIEKFYPEKKRLKSHSFIIPYEFAFLSAPYCAIARKLDVVLDTEIGAQD